MPQHPGAKNAVKERLDKRALEEMSPAIVSELDSKSFFKRRSDSGQCIKWGVANPGTCFACVRSEKGSQNFRFAKWSKRKENPANVIDQSLFIVLSSFLRSPSDSPKLRLVAGKGVSFSGSCSTIF